MPELPEVETVCRGLTSVVTGKTISSITLGKKNLRVPFPKDLKNVAQHKIIAVRRRAKYILLDLDDGRTMIVHLGMSGRMVIHPPRSTASPQKHDHMVLHLNDDTQIVFNDPRRFGLVDLCRTVELESHKLFSHLGVEPLEKEFSPLYLQEKLSSKSIAIKLAIMDQEIVVGVGNIYAAESLFMAGIDPRRAAKDVSPEEIKALVSAIKKVLKAAIAAGGSSLKDYVQADGELGYFQHHFSVYGREGQPCKDCSCSTKKTGGVLRLTQGGRSTFYCPTKQK